MDKICPKSAAIYITQMIIAIGIVIASIINLSLQSGNSELWLSLLFSNLGWVTPSPSLKKQSAESLQPFQMRRRQTS